MHAVAVATVAAPASRVWAVLADHEGMSAWAPGLQVEMIKHGDLVRNGVGAQRRFTPLKVFPSFTEEITTFEENRRLSYRAVAGIPFRNYVGDVRLHEVSGATEIRYTVSADTPLPGVAAALAHGLLFALKRQVNRAT